MTGLPQSLSETPEMGSDPLSDLLAGMHLSGTVLFSATFREPWSVAAPEAQALARVLPFKTEKIIPFHLVAAGGCWLEMPGSEPVWLGEGDAILLAHGDGHRVRGEAPAESIGLDRLVPPPPWSAPPSIDHGGRGPATRLICGFVQCDELLFHPLAQQLPRLLHARSQAGSGDSWLASTVRRTIAEASRPAPGSRGMAPRLTEIMFVEMLRDFLRDLPADEVGWFAAFNDKVAGTALRRLHAAPLEPWNLERLSREAGASRSVLCERFGRYLGQPPMRYLAQLRLQLAAQMLRSGDLPVKAVAEASGYDSEAAFSRAFKRRFGTPPADWRRSPGD